MEEAEFNNVIAGKGFVIAKDSISAVRERHIITYRCSDENNKMSIERTIDSIYFGKKKKDVFVVTTVSVITSNQQYYDSMKDICKQNGYTSNSDISNSAIQLEEYRSAASVVHFYEEVPKGNTSALYKIAVHISPE